MVFLKTAKNVMETMTMKDMLKIASLGSAAIKGGSALFKKGTKSKTVKGRRRTNNSVKVKIVNVRGRGRTVKGKSQVKGRRPPKISPLFKKKVKAAMQPSVPTGVYENRMLAFLQEPGVDNKQDCESDVFQNFTAANAPANGIPLDFFSSVQLQDVAAVLFNGKTKATDFSIATNNFAHDKLKLTVVSATADIKFYNNSQVTKQVLLYECVAKNASQVARAIDDWDVMHNQDIAGGVNLSSGSIDTWGMHPSYSKTFQKAWNVKHTLVVIKPGESASLKIGGLKNQTIDFRGNKDSTTVDRYLKGISKSCFYITRTIDVLGAFSGGGAAYPIHPAHTRTSPSYFNLACEVHWKYVIKAPDITEDTRRMDVYTIEPTGLTAGATTTNANLSKVDPNNLASYMSNAGNHGTGAGPYVA